jgi:glycosyltransferase involved in cell wall biosynthesis
MANPKYSIIVPVYNRPDEIQELLESLTKQTYADFEVLIVEDGSSLRCEQVVMPFTARLNLRYFYKVNEGPGPSRNFGYQQARGDFFVVFDSDCIIPPDYFLAVEAALLKDNLDAWGGPDKPHENFTLLQRAMGYTMSSFLTTGGIRGGKKRIGWFQPRSFNMGISRAVFESTKGFKFDRYAEDIEFSIRMKNAGFRVGLIESAYVYHKRRTTFSQFYNQVKNFGKGRALIGKEHPGEVKLTHWFPTIFLTGTILVFLITIFHVLFPELYPIPARIIISGFVLYVLAIFIHSWISNKNIKVAILSMPSAVLQLCGYGVGFLTEWLKPYVAKKP